MKPHLQRRRKARRAVSLLELMLGTGIFTLVMIVLVSLFNQSLLVWRNTSGSDTANRELRKVRASLERDLVLSQPDQLARVSVSDHLSGGGKDGEALWFLSPVDPATGQIARKDDGSPMWMRNILYYLVVPANHDATFGMNCKGGPGPGGYDDRCPHKLLVRKVIDSGTATIASDETTEETLIPDITPYLTQPAGFDLSGMAEAGLEDKRIVANSLLTFSSQSAPPPENVGTEVAVDVRALSLEEARRSIQVGNAPASTSQFTLQSPFSVFLRN